jgi:hypothetical protein
MIDYSNQPARVGQVERAPMQGILSLLWVDDKVEGLRQSKETYNGN